jgi:E3 ubiquitin-protein ligase RBX1
MEQPEKLINVLEWNPTGFWKYKNATDDCGICKEKLTEPCINCIQNTVGKIDCYASQGKCNHCYHKHCIDKWRESSSICPTDKKPWAFAVENMSSKLINHRVIKKD